jgi:hypothetical protein
MMVCEGRFLVVIESPARALPFKHEVTSIPWWFNNSRAELLSFVACVDRTRIRACLAVESKK